ncbi:hypothetical protein V3C99_014912 [Haemonchus contortus]
MGRQHIRVLLVARPHRNLMCRFPNGTVIDGGKLYEMSENHAMMYGVYFLNCPLPPNERLADRIEVKIATKTALWRSVPIIYDIPHESAIKEYKYELTICLPFLFGHKYTAEHFIEFMELNRLLGVDHFVVYVNGSSVPESVREVAEFYEQLGLLVISRLKMPVRSKYIWYHGQLVSITDCLYRNMGVSRFVVFQDLDEFLIPQKPNSSVEAAPLLATLNAIFVKDVAAIRVPAQYMRITEPGGLKTLRNTIRRHTLEFKLTKCVVRPEMVFEQGIHHTSRVIQDHYEVLDIGKSSLLLYHFKNMGGFEIDDTIPMNYGDRLRQRYDEVLKKIHL